MKWFFRFLVLFLLIAGWALAALSVHLVRATNTATGQERWVVVPKARMAISDTYADVRAWTVADLAEHRALVTRLIESGKADVLTPLVPAEHQGDVAGFLRDALAKPPTTAPTAPPGT